MKVRRSSWHYWVSTFPDGYPRESDTVCSYLRSVVKGLFWLIALAAVIISLAYSTISTIGWLASVILLPAEIRIAWPGYWVIPFLVTILILVWFGFEDYLINLRNYCNRTKCAKVVEKLVNCRCTKIDFIP